MCVTLAHTNLLVDTRPRDLALDFQDGGKITPCVDLRNKGKNNSVQVFKTVQGGRGWRGLFEIVLAAYCCGMFVPASLMFYITFHLLSVRGFKVFQVLATEWTVLLLFRHNLMFVSL